MAIPSGKEFSTQDQKKWNLSETWQGLRQSVNEAVETLGQGLSQPAETIHTVVDRAKAFQENNPGLQLSTVEQARQQDSQSVEASQKNEGDLPTVRDLNPETPRKELEQYGVGGRYLLTTRKSVAQNSDIHRDKIAWGEGDEQPYTLEAVEENLQSAERSLAKYKKSKDVKDLQATVGSLRKVEAVKDKKVFFPQDYRAWTARLWKEVHQAQIGLNAESLRHSGSLGSEQMEKIDQVEGYYKEHAPDGPQDIKPQPLDDSSGYIEKPKPLSRMQQNIEGMKILFGDPEDYVAMGEGMMNGNFASFVDFGSYLLPTGRVKPMQRALRAPARSFRRPSPDRRRLPPGTSRRPHPVGPAPKRRALSSAKETGTPLLGGKFYSNDPLVPETVKAIEKKYPGLVSGVEVKTFKQGKNGAIVGDLEYDIVLANGSVIEVKSGKKLHGFKGQMESLEFDHHRVSVGFAPELKGRRMEMYKREGFLVVNSLDELLELIRPGAKLANAMGLH